jgi:pyridoxamine 5'-phosphate oxidase
MALTPEALAALRQDYSQRGLLETELHADPIHQFQAWLGEAQAQGILEPNAMTLSTVDECGQPWSRIVLLKRCDADGFSFFTNYEGSKAQHISSESRVGLTFWWGALERQVNVVGTASKVSREESEAYFATRPIASQLGAWASRQSSRLGARAELESSFAELKQRFEGKPIPCPPHWGGFVVKPSSIEFWQGRRSRLHDRLRFTSSGDGWLLERLAP